MKKSKRTRQADAGAPASTTKAPLTTPGFAWWPWLAGAAALFLTFSIYGPALSGPFLLDDRYLPFFNPTFQGAPLSAWLAGTRPLLNLSFWINHQISGTDPFAFHATNVFLHVLVAVVVALIATRLLETVQGSSKQGTRALGVFAGALFLVHPLQTESVAYVASRSEVLSVLFYYSAYCVFLYRRTDAITWTRALFITLLFGAALACKEHTLTLPALFLLTDLVWNPDGFKAGLKANLRLYALLVAGSIVGALWVWRVLGAANTAGFFVKGLSPLSYFFTECRVLWIYVRLFFVPVGQNADPEVALSTGLMDHGAILALLAWIGVAVAAWIYRKRWPLASFGLFIYLLLLAPTSSFVPIQDVMQERRMYLPFLGLSLVCLELLRRSPVKRRMMIEAPILLVLAMLTFQRAELWGNPLALWQDTADKSPGKVRPRFQLAFAYGEQRNYAKAAENYEIASRLAPPDYPLLVDWGKALEDSGKLDDAVEKYQRATAAEYDPQAWVLLGEARAKQHRVDEALMALEQAQRINPNYIQTYAVRGNVYEAVSNFPLAAEQYQKALALDPTNEPVQQALARVRNR